MNMKKDVPLAHAGMAAQFDLQKQYYAEGEVFICLLYTSDAADE